MTTVFRSQTEQQKIARRRKADNQIIALAIVLPVVAYIIGNAAYTGPAGGAVLLLTLAFFLYLVPNFLLSLLMVVAPPLKTRPLVIAGLIYWLVMLGVLAWQ